MKMTKRLATLAACAVMAASSMVGMGAFAADVSVYNSFEQLSTHSNDVPVGLTSVLHTVFNIPRYKQSGNTCWLECVRSIVNYKLGTDYSDNDIYAIMQESPTIETSENGGLTGSNTVTLLNRIFSKNKSSLSAKRVTKTLSYDDIKKSISKDNPMIMVAKNTVTGNSHDVVISGYATCVQDCSTHKVGDYTGLVLMNPQDGSEAFYYDSNTNDTSFAFTNSENSTYNWYQTIIIE